MTGKLRLPAVAVNLYRVLDFVGGMLKETRFPEDEASRIAVAVEEIFVNIALYAYAPAIGGVTVTCTVIPEPLSVSVAFRDRGRPYNPLLKQAPDRTLLLEARKAGGWGVQIVREFTDSAVYVEDLDVRKAITLRGAVGQAPIIRAAKPGNISAFPAEVVANRAIGGADSSHFVLTFRAPEMQEVWPSQFVMMDCAPEKFLLTPRRVQRGRELDELLHLPPFPLLKRPFGIQRAYYRHFDRLYQKQLALPPSLALALHTVYPHQFDMLYKVLPGGGGTPLLARLQFPARLFLQLP
jgi:anti-sigma regulatory factor (Ser/Thr protein kinase)